MPAVIEPPGLLIYIVISSPGALASRKRSSSVTCRQRLSSTSPQKNTLRSSRNLRRIISAKAGCFGSFSAEVSSSQSKLGEVCHIPGSKSPFPRAGKSRGENLLSGERVVWLAASGCLFFVVSSREERFARHRSLCLMLQSLPWFLCLGLLASTIHAGAETSLAVEWDPATAAARLRLQGGEPALIYRLESAADLETWVALVRGGWPGVVVRRRFGSVDFEAVLPGARLGTAGDRRARDLAHGDQFPRRPLRECADGGIE